MNSAIPKSSSIPELMKIIKNSFRECEFKEVQDILTDREKNMTMEMTNLIRDRNSMKEEILLLERSQSVTELEKLKLEENLQISDRECEKLKERVTRLTEELTVSRDREKRAEERYNKICKENSKVASENNKLKLELNQKTSELKTKKLDSEHLFEEFMEKLKNSDEKMSKIGEEMKNLSREKSVVDRRVEDLRRKLLEADQVVELLKRQNLEATKNVEDLRVKKVESDKSAELYKSRLESLAARIMKVEEELANIMNVKVENLAHLVDTVEKPVAVEEGAKVESPKEERGSLGNGSREDEGIDDAENVVIMSPGTRSTCNSAGSGCTGLTKKDSCAEKVNFRGRNVDLSSLRKEDATNTGQTSPGLQSGYNPSRADSNNNDKDNGHQRKPVKMPTSSFAAANIIEICDSDDDQNEIIAEKFTHTPSSSNTNKRKKTDFQDDSNINSIKKRKGSTCDDIPIDEKDNEIRMADSDSDSENESCSDSHIEGLLASMKSTRRWNFVADMLQDFNESEEPVLDAVCALYRQQIRVEKSSPGSKLSKSVRDLAKYLIDGDSEMRRRKSVSEVKQQRPDVINECRRLANFKIEQLHEIYCSKDDPFFRQI